MMKREKDGGDGGRGSGHHSLSQLTQPSGVAVSRFPLSPPMSLARLSVLAFSLSGDRRRGISRSINHGSSFHCSGRGQEEDRTRRCERGGGGGVQCRVAFERLI